MQIHQNIQISYHLPLFHKILQRKIKFLKKYKHITLNNDSMEVLMDPSSSVVTYVKPELVEKKVFRHKDKVGNLWKEIHKVVVNDHK